MCVIIKSIPLYLGGCTRIYWVRGEAYMPHSEFKRINEERDEEGFTYLRKSLVMQQLVLRSTRSAITASRNLASLPMQSVLKWEPIFSQEEIWLQSSETN